MFSPRALVGGSLGCGEGRIEGVGLSFNLSYELAPFHIKHFFSFALHLENSDELMHIDLG